MIAFYATCFVFVFAVLAGDDPFDETTMLDDHPHHPHSASKDPVHA